MKKKSKKIAPTKLTKNYFEDSFDETEMKTGKLNNETFEWLMRADKSFD